MKAFSQLTSPRALVLAGLVLPVCVVCILGAVIHASNAQVTRTADWVNHTLVVKERLAYLHQRLVEAESSQRGYLLTRREEYLTPFTGAQAELPVLVRKLHELMSTVPIQQTRLNQLETIIAKKMAELNETVNLERENQPEEALTIVLGNTGKRAMDAIDKAIGELMQEEDLLLASREANRKKISTENLILSWALVSAALVCVGTVVLSLKRLEHARNLISVCAWSKTIEFDGDWLSFEDYLRRRFDAEISHGISPAEVEKWTT